MAQRDEDVCSRIQRSHVRRPVLPFADTSIGIRLIPCREVTYTPREKALGIFSRGDLVEARRIPSVAGSLVETGCEYISLALQSVCDAVRGSAAWLTGSLIPTVSRAYSYMCGDPVDLGGGTATGLVGQSLPSYSAATTSTIQSTFSGNLRVRATDQTRRKEEEYRGRFTYEDLLGARGYDADVVCQVMKGKFSVKKPHTWRNRKAAREENDWIEVFDVASDGSQNFDASYLLPDPSSNQYQIQNYCDRSKPSIILNKQLSEKIDDWVSYERQTAGSMTE